jgi:uncharacterized protein YbaP (TraB family)
VARLGLIFFIAAWQTAAADPAVWHFSPGPGTDVWLLGSVHYLREQDHPLPGIVDELYDAADTLVMEIDLDDLDPAAVQLQFMQAAMLPTSMRLDGVLGVELYSTTASAAAELGLDMRTFNAFEPWFVALTLMDLGMARLGFRAEQGLEQHLLRLAARDGKPVLGLESLVDQLEIFDDLPLAEQRALLDQTLGEIDAARADMDALMTAWRDGSLDVLSRELAATFDEFPTLYESLVVARNQRWIEEIEQLAARPGRYLIVVGALHLVGERSVVDLLSDNGFEVARLSR